VRLSAAYRPGRRHDSRESDIPDLLCRPIGRHDGQAGGMSGRLPDAVFGGRAGRCQGRWP